MFDLKQHVGHICSCSVSFCELEWQKVPSIKKGSDHVQSQKSYVLSLTTTSTKNIFPFVHSIDRKFVIDRLVFRMKFLIVACQFIIYVTTKYATRRLITLFFGECCFVFVTYVWRRTTKIFFMIFVFYLLLIYLFGEKFLLDPWTLITLGGK